MLMLNPPPLYFLCFMCSSVSGLCQFSGLTASCKMTLGGVPVIAYARVNHCHSPVDISFQVHGEPPSNLSWRYTYVTTNLAENVDLSPHIMLVMMANQVEKSGRLRVQAKFLLDGGGGPELEFLNTDLHLPPQQKNCVIVGGGQGWIAGACLLGLGVATLVVGVAVVKSRSAHAGQGTRTGFRRRFPHGNTGGTVVQYVVPADTPSDLKVYVSKADGLQPVDRDVAKPTAELQLTSTDLTVGITNDGYVSDEGGDQTKETILDTSTSSTGECSAGEDVVNGRKLLVPSEGVAKNNNSLHQTDLAATGAIPKRRYEA